MLVFVNSSRDAYTVSCFGRFIYKDNSVSFLFGKCKVLPIGGTLTIHGLELVAATLDTRDIKSMVQESNVKYNRSIYWSDSLSTLHLIQNNTRRFYVFVNSCLSEIRESSCVSDWKYCPMVLNPADQGTRLISPKNKKKFLQWTKGPEFVLLAEQEW